MINLVLLLSVVGYTCCLFVIGRFHAPASERLPYRELDSTAMIHTIVRGWYALSTENRINRLINRIAPDDPDTGAESA